MKLKNNSVWVAVGDSITDCGRLRPVGEGGGVGDGYVFFVDALINAAYPERHVRLLNTGISGNTVRDLAARWRRDVLALHPTWVSVMIGTNDVWRQFDSYAFAAVMPDEFERVYRSLVLLTRPNLDGMVLMTPFYIQPNRTDLMRARMDEYGAIVKRIAADLDCLFVDTQAAFDSACESIDPFSIAADRVHPSPYGSAILARALLKELDFQF